MMPDPREGRIVDNLTSVVLVNNTAKTIDITVPANRRWVLYFIKAVNNDDVNRNITVSLYKEAAKTNLLANLGYKAAVLANGGSITIPSHVPAAIESLNINAAFPLPLDHGHTISVTWATGGASTGSTDADGLAVYVKEYDL